MAALAEWGQPANKAIKPSVTVTAKAATQEATAHKKTRNKLSKVRGRRRETGSLPTHGGQA